MADLIDANVIGEFPIGDSGYVFIEADWVPDPDVIVQALLKLANDIDDWSEPLHDSLSLIIRDTDQHFIEQTDPYGNPWAELATKTEKQKLRMGAPGGILERHFRLHDYVGSREAWIVGEKSIAFNEEGLPGAVSDDQPYGIFHQLGTESDANRIFRLGEQLEGKERDKYFETHREAVLAFQTNTGKGKDLPQRMFIGIDEGTEDEIADVFSDWLDRKIDIDYEGPYTEMGRNVFGEFPVAFFLPTGQPMLSTPLGVMFGTMDTWFD